MNGLYFVLILLGGVSWLVQYMLKSRFKKFSHTSLESNMSGAEVAERMLADYGIHDVKVAAVSGHLTDHYHPVTKMVNLSEAVYHERNAAAAAVAAHECGHAVQHAKGYAFLKFRSAMVPVLTFSNRFTPILLSVGVAILMASNFAWVLAAGVIFYAVSTLFSIVTLPVEFDASRRALKWIEQENIVTDQEHRMAKSALFWAAMTYVVAAISSIVMLLYYASMLLNRRR